MAMVRKAAMKMAGLWVMAMVIGGCDAQKGDAGPCVLGSESDPQAELFLLPSVAEAGKLDAAIKNRQQATVNLLLAKYTTKAVAGGSTCKVLESKETFIKVTAEPSGVTGWLPKDQLRGADE